MSNFFSGIAFGVSSFLNFLGVLPVARTYDNLVVYCDSTNVTIIDNVHIKNRPFTNAEITAINPASTPIWDGETLLLATFDNNLNAGNITNIVNPITSFDIFRKKSTDLSFTKLGTVGSTSSNFYDLTAQPNVVYTYQVFAKNNTEISEPLQNTLNSDFYLWALIDEDSEKVFVFDNNLKSEPFGNEIAYQRYDGYNQYSGYSFGDRNFLIGGVEAILSSSNTEIVQPIEYVRELRYIINNGKTKILKSRKGHVLRVVTHSFEATPLDDGIGEQPYLISFKFEESGEVNG